MNNKEGRKLSCVAAIEITIPSSWTIMSFRFHSIIARRRHRAFLANGSVNEPWPWNSRRRQTFFYNNHSTALYLGTKKFTTPSGGPSINLQGDHKIVTKGRPTTTTPGDFDVLLQFPKGYWMNSLCIVINFNSAFVLLRSSKWILISRTRLLKFNDNLVEIKSPTSGSLRTSNFFRPLSIEMNTNSS